MGVRLIVGLRNPGNNYAATRHNAGAWLVTLLAARHNLIFKTSTALKSELAKIESDNIVCYLMLPQTFMNNSGVAVRAVVNFYKIAAHDILIVHDDLDLAIGRVQLKVSGGHGGHNGLRDIIMHLGTSDFNRLRIGIGRPSLQGDIVDYVLNKPPESERQLILAAIERGLDVMPVLFNSTMQQAMTILRQV